MHLLVISRVYPPFGFGGLAKHLTYLYDEIASRGHSVTILAGKCDGFRLDENDAEQPQIKNVEVKRVNYRFRKGFYLTFPLYLRKYLSTFDTSSYDAVITHTQVPFEFDIPVIAKHHDCIRRSRQFVRRGMPFWMKLGESALNLFRVPIDRLALQSADHAIYNSRMVQKDWQELYTSTPPSTVIYNGVDMDTFYPRDEHIKDDFVLFVTGSGDGWKNKLEHSGVMSFASESKYDVYVAGRSDVDHADINALSRLDHDTLAEYYSAAIATIHPSMYEPFGNVVLESLACGTPVVTNETVGAHEIIDDDCGVVTSDLVEGVRTARRLSERNCIMKAQEHTWERVADETLNIIRPMI